MRYLTGPSTRRSPSIRSPSLLQSSPLPTLPSRNSLSRNSLSRNTIRILQGLIVLLVGWYEYGIFYLQAQKGWNCFIQQQEPSHSTTPPEGEGFKVLIVTDPQLLDMEKSYLGRNRGLKWLSIKITNQFMKKCWKFLSKTNRGIDAVVWNGDLLDNGREMEIRDDGSNDDEYSSYTRLFHQLFPLPRQHLKTFSSSSSTTSSHSSSSSSSSHHELDPPVPVIYVPGNHDLPLHPPLSSISNSTEVVVPISVKTRREKFKESFGPLWGERELGGWNLIWIDAIGLIEQGFWNNNDNSEEEGNGFREMRNWLESLGKGSVTVPRILFTHIPLFRPPSTSCGTSRESKNFGGGIRDGYGKGYQNLIGKLESDWLIEKVRPEKVFSGDDHDYCFVQHDRYTSTIDQTRKISETTVKSFSMAMGVSNPGYSFLTLYPPSLSNLSTTPPNFTEHSCLLPSQLGIYLHVYLPLSVSLFLFFLIPKLRKVWKSFLKRFRKSRRRRRNKARLSGISHSRRRGLLGSSNGRRGTMMTMGGGKGGQGQGQEEEDDEFSTINSTPDSTVVGEYGYSAALTGRDDGEDGSEPISNRPSPSPLRREYGDDDDGDEEEDEEDSSTEEEEVDGTESRGGRSRRPSKVRRVSKVWLWEKDSNSSSSLLSSPRLSSSAGVSLPRYSISGGYDDEPSSLSILSRFKELLQRLINRISQNSLLLPFLRLLRPIVRSLRTLLFVLLGKPLEWVTRLLGGDKGIGRAFKEAGKEFWEVTWGGIVVWVVVWVWVGM
ncbi:hypothetical protein JCM5350_005675 [Sporobolomyces pararoseus]